MALATTTVWEVQSGGSQNNGGGYNPANAAPGTDRSQTAAAYKEHNDLAIDGVDNTKVTSAAHAFTSDDNGNIIHITAGTNFTQGWYEVVSVDGSNIATLDRACGTAGATGGTYYLGGAFLIGGSLDDDWFDALSGPGGATVYISGGNAENTTYTLGETVGMATAGSAATVIDIIGYRASRGDAPTGTYRPIISTGAAAFNTSQYTNLYYLAFTGTASTVCNVANYGKVVNCKAAVTSSTSNRTAMAIGGYTRAMGCEATAADGATPKGNAFSLSGGAAVLLYSYAHNADVGVLFGGNIQTVIGCVIASCTAGSYGYGINVNSRYGSTVISNTIYGCTVGVLGTTSYADAFINNILDGCTTGAAWDSQVPNNLWEYNCWNNTTDVSNVTKGSNDITGDPGLNDPANGDFSITSADTNAYAKGLDAQVYTSAIVRAA